MFLMILMDIVILFQSTPPRGRRRIVRTSTFAPGMHFNPRLREGGDSAWLPIWFASGYFNPRLREGGDVYEAFYADKYFISIHASAREATSLQSSILLLKNISIHASAREATGMGRKVSQKRHISIHASAREATWRTWNIRSNKYLISIHASAREATALITKIHLKHHISFQHTVHKSPFNVNYPFQ